MGAFVGTVNKIEEVGLENLVYAYVKNFKSLVPRTAVGVGDTVIFIEPDSVLPDAAWATTYKKYAPKRVKPIKLGGVLTEGIIVLVNSVAGVPQNPEVVETFAAQGINDAPEDTDVSELLGVTKYEPPLPNEQGSVGQLPFWLPKTDETRWEHLPIDAIVGSDRLVTLKIDGSSTTFVVMRDEEDVRVYSRSLEYADDGTSNYSRVLDTELSCGATLRDEIYDSALAFFYSDENADAVIFRGELHGKNIQKRGKNPHADGPLAWSMYGAYVYNSGELVSVDFTSAFCDSSVDTIVPFETMDVDEKFITTIQEGGALRMAPEYYEGVVIHFPAYYYKGRFVHSCKVINKVYDSKI